MGAWGSGHTNSPMQADRITRIVAPMKSLFLSSRVLMGRLHALLKLQTEDLATAVGSGSRGESLFKLHETQNRVILSIYKISISGLVAIFLILLSFTLFMLSDPLTPAWVSYLLVGVEGLLVLGFVRTLYDFRAYRKHYGEVSARLRELLRQQRQSGGAAQSKGGELRLINALKPKEHQGWDAKACTQCEKAIEMTAGVCQHCGQDQGQVLAN